MPTKVHIVMWELDHNKDWTPKNWCFQIVVLEKSLESPFDSKEITPVNPKGSQSWIFIGRTDAEAETPILWPPDMKSWLTGKDPSAGKDWRQEEKGTTEDEIVGWHHWPNGHEFEQTPGDRERQGSLACCSPWGHKKLDMTKQWNSNTEGSKSERKKQISSINVYIWNLEKWCWWSYLQGRNTDVNVDNRLVGTVGEGEGGTN